MEKTGRAIIFINDKLLSIKRVKIRNGKEYIYYTIPGGHVENCETFEETTLREVEEELGIKVKIKKEVLSMFNQDLNRHEKFFLCEYVSGEIGTGTGEEWQSNETLYGKYEICYIEIKKIQEYNLLPFEIKEIIKNI